MPARRPEPRAVTIARQHRVKPPGGDIASSGGDYGSRRAVRAMRAAPFKRAVRATADEQRGSSQEAGKAPVDRYREILRHATGPVALALAPIHEGRVARDRLRRLSQATRDTKSAESLAIGMEYLNAHPEILSPRSHGGTGGPLGTLATISGGLADLAAGQVQKNNPVAALNLPGGGKLAANAARDLVNLPSSTLIGGIETIGALGALAGGNTKPIERIGKGLAAGALGHLAAGDVKGAAKYFGEHPVFAGLEFTGAGKLAGGLVQKAGEVSGAGFANTARGSLRPIPGAKLEVDRSFSRGPVKRLLQKAVEQGQRARNIDPRSPQGARRTRLIHQAVDEFAAQREGLRRQSRTEGARAGVAVTPTRMGDASGSRTQRVLAAVDRAAPTMSRPERDVVSLAVERRVNNLKDPAALKADLTRVRDRLQKVYVERRMEMGADARHANRGTVRSLTRVIEDPKALARVHSIAGKAEEYIAHATALEPELQRLGLLDPEQGLTAKVRPYAVENMGARWDRREQRLVSSSGHPLDTRAVLAHMRENGIDTAGFVAHRRNTGSGFAYFVNALPSRKALRTGRTGAATEMGTHDIGMQALTEHLVHTRGVIEAAKGLDEFVGQFGVKHQSGRAFNWAEAERYAQEYKDRTGLAMTPMRVVQARYDAATRQAILDAQDSGHLPSAIVDMFERKLGEMTSPPSNESRLVKNVVLVPEQALARYKAHQLARSTTLGKAGQAVTTAFRQTVLPFSTKWLTGNTAEAVLRLQMELGPNPAAIPAAMLRGYRLLGALSKEDRAAYREMDVRTRGGLLYGGGQRLEVHRGAQDFENTVLQTPAQALAVVRHSAPFRLLFGALHGFTRGVFAFNRGMERAAQTAAIGAVAKRQALELGVSWRKAVTLQGDVAQELARGLRGTATQVRYAREVDRMLGQYGRFSPSTRRFVQAVAPFLPWYLNSWKFVYHALPRDHPALVSLTHTANQVFAQDWADGHKDAPPGGLQTAIPNGKGGYVDVGRFTPFGAFTQDSASAGGFAKQAAGFALPQFSSAYNMIANHVAFTGAPLRVSSGKPVSDNQALTLAAYSFLESVLPGLQIVRRLREGGATAFDDSTVLSPRTKPGTSHGSALLKVVNPARAVYPGGAGRVSGRRVSSGPLGDFLAGEQGGASVVPHDDLLGRYFGAAGR